MAVRVGTQFFDRFLHKMDKDKGGTQFWTKLIGELNQSQNIGFNNSLKVIELQRVSK